MKFIYTLFFAFFKLSAIDVYLLPDHTSDAINILQNNISKTNNHLIIITSEFNSDRLSNSLQKLVDKNIKITLVVSSESIQKSSYLAQYKNIELRILEGLQNTLGNGKINTSIVFRDEQEVCISSLPLDERSMRIDIGFMECHYDSQHLKTYLRHATTLVSRSEAYLK